MEFFIKSRIKVVFCKLNIYQKSKWIINIYIWQFDEFKIFKIITDRTYLMKSNLEV